jgi:hypothetical protein
MATTPSITLSLIPNPETREYPATPITSHSYKGELECANSISHRPSFAGLYFVSVKEGYYYENPTSITKVIFHTSGTTGKFSLCAERCPTSKLWS